MSGQEAMDRLVAGIRPLLDDHVVVTMTPMHLYVGHIVFTDPGDPPVSCRCTLEDAGAATPDSKRWTLVVPPLIRGFTHAISKRRFGGGPNAGIGKIALHINTWIKAARQNQSATAEAESEASRARRLFPNATRIERYNSGMFSVQFVGETQEIEDKILRAAEFIQARDKGQGQ